MSKKALIIVDYQNDFVSPNGTLFIPEGLLIKNYLLDLIQQFKDNNDKVIATLDWHPKKHISFKQWPVHAVKNTWGAELVIDKNLFDKLIYKGNKLNSDSYSAFMDDDGSSNQLHEYLQENNINDLVIVGLATDFCVSYTFRDAVDLKYNVVLDLDGCRGTENKLVYFPNKYLKK